jgi:anti-anti-sigma factor
MGRPASCRLRVVLYTDGMVERPGQTMREGMRALRKIVADAVFNRAFPVGAPSSAVQRVCEQGVELTTRNGYDDDVTVLAVQRRPEPVTPLRLQAPADPAQIAGLRAAVHAWLQPLSLSARDEQVVDLAVTELVANVIEHAYQPGQRGTIRVSAQLSDDGLLQVQVTDDGAWKRPTGPPDTSGRGLWMIRSAVDELELNPPAPDGSTSGTTVIFRHRLRRAVMLAAESEPVATRPPARELVTVLDDGPPRTLKVSGPLDISTADRFADRLDIVSRGGIYPIVLDLSEVDILASAAVRVLFRVRDELAAQGHRLRLHAAPNTPADHVLTLVGLDEPGHETA